MFLPDCPVFKSPSPFSWFCQSLNCLLNVFMCSILPLWIIKDSFREFLIPCSSVRDTCTLVKKYQNYIWSLIFGLTVYSSVIFTLNYTHLNVFYKFLLLSLFFFCCSMLHHLYFNSIRAATLLRLSTVITRFAVIMQGTTRYLLTVIFSEI